MTRSTRVRDWLLVLRFTLAFVICVAACDHSDVVADVVPQRVMGEAGEGGVNGSAGASGASASGGANGGSADAGTDNGGSANAGARNGAAGEASTIGEGGSSAVENAAGAAGIAGEAGAGSFTVPSAKPSCLITLKGYSYVHAIASDAQGNWFVAGSLQGTVDFGGKTRSSTGNAELDLFFAKYTANCVLAWVQSFSSNSSAGPSSVDQGLSIAVAPNGDVVVAGFAAGALDLGGGLIAKNGGAFYARYTTDGAHVWSHLVGKDVSFGARGIAVASNGDIALSAEAGTDPRISPAYVARYDGSGNQIWKTPIDLGQPSLLNTNPFGVAADANANVFVTGSYCSQSTPCSGTTDAAFVAAYGATGALAWKNTVTSGAGAPSDVFNEGRAVTADASHVVAVGAVTPPVDFGAGTLSSTASAAAFFARYADTGNLTKAFLSGSGPDYAVSVALDEASNLFVVEQLGTTSAALAYTPGGQQLWLEPLDTFSLEAVALAPNHTLAIVGEFTGHAIDFGDGVARTTSGSQDSFIVVYGR